MNWTNYSSRQNNSDCASYTQIFKSRQVIQLSFGLPLPILLSLSFPVWTLSGYAIVANSALSSPSRSVSSHIQLNEIKIIV